MTTTGPSPKLVVTHIVSGDIWAGAEAQVFQLISGLQANSAVKPTVVLFNPGILFDKLTALGVDVTLADESASSSFNQIKTIFKHLRHHSSDILHTHGLKENVLGVVSRYLAGVKHSVLTVHGSPEFQLSWRTPAKKITQLLNRTLTRFCHDAVIAVSQHLAGQIAPLYPKKTIVIKNFVDTEKGTAIFPSQPYGTRALNAPHGITLVGRCVPVKRIDLFIDTISSLRTDHKLEVNGRICGDGPLLESMKQYAEAKGMAQFIHFTGFVQDMEPEWAAMDVLVMPSDHEGLPMTLLEALLRNVPVIAHNAGGIPEVLDHGNCGILVDNHSAAGYANQIARLINHQEVAKDFAAKGQNHIKKEFSKRENVKKYEALYKSVLQNKQYFIHKKINIG